MARYCIVYDETFKLHMPPYGSHPESPSRLDRALRGIQGSGLASWWDMLQPSPRRGAEKSHILRVHDASYVREVEKLAEMGGGYLDADTYVGAYTVDAAKAYVAALLDAVDRLASGECRAAMVLGRPPGHHAGRAGAAMGAPTLGFCIFNISAIAATYAEYRFKDYILMVDFDLHHGNGTQEILYDNPSIIHLDLHQDPSTIYPGTGWPWEYGSGKAKGTKINVILPPDTGDDVYTQVFSLAMEMVVELYGIPAAVVVDAGFDGYIGDGLGLLRLTSNTYYRLGAEIAKLNTPVLVVFEGGYSLGLERGLPAFLAGLAGLANPAAEEATESRRTVWKVALENFEKLRNTIMGVAGKG
jgi:acetoin utilization deacetylase AcuC-like enzyme